MSPKDLPGVVSYTKITARYLSTAVVVLGPSLHYVSDWHDDSSAVLEFEAELDGVYVRGLDMLRWNGDGKLVSFTVMVRPMRRRS
jgi:hypothetical protein